jgi:hypothetical protein
LKTTWPSGASRLKVELAISWSTTAHLGPPEIRIAVFRLALRQTEGLIGSVIRLLGLDLAIPDHSTLSRRAETLAVARPPSSAEPAHLLVDSTGLKLSGAGEWLVEKHGTSRRGSWRKLHIGVDARARKFQAHYPLIAIALAQPFLLPFRFFRLNCNPLDLVEAHVIAPAIVELRRARRGLVRHRRGFLQCAAVLENGRDPGCAETVVAKPSFDAGCGPAPADHCIGVRLRRLRAGELAGAAADRAEQRPFGIVTQAHAVEITDQIFLEVVVADIACHLPPFSRSRTHSRRFCV